MLGTAGRESEPSGITCAFLHRSEG
uniref:Uncharacterized protein n=1 Tax=Anguilla anguilla TaxID=7936 RepID=A0A0E9V9B9_ANGAN